LAGVTGMRTCRVDFDQPRFMPQKFIAGNPLRVELLLPTRAAETRPIEAWSYRSGRPDIENKKRLPGCMPFKQSVNCLTPIWAAGETSRYTDLKENDILCHVLIQREGARMAVREVDYHYLRTNVVRAEPRRFPSLTEAMAAMDDLLRLQKERGFDTVRDGAGRHTSRHLDGRTVQFWAENEQGDIVS
jgi:hypothetical protein